MGYVVLGASILQLAAGCWLLGRWLRAGGKGVSIGVVHGASVVAALAVWIVFLVTDVVAWAWITFVVLTIALSIGDTMLIGRNRRSVKATRGFWRDYGASIAAVFRGRMPGLVVFHALFSPVVYFGCLGVAIGATVA